jgi:LysM repeat protein/murein endopeptidase
MSHTTATWRPVIAAVVALSAVTFAHRPAAAEEHEVARGETLGEIARAFDCPEKVIRSHNKLRGSRLKAGQRVAIPDEACEAARKGPGVVTHLVLAGEQLSDLASRYLTTEQAIIKQNGKKATSQFWPGQKLKVKTTDKSRAQGFINHRIEAGDTLERIARKYGLTARDLARMNPKRKTERMRIGDTLQVLTDGKRGRSRAVGKPQNGRLEGALQLQPGPGYFVRRPNAAWGTAEMLRGLKEAFHAVNKKHKDAHDVVVGDLSREKGGHLSPHKSHQTGLDADVGWYFKGLKKAPNYFLDASQGKLDLDATWTLLDALAGASEAKSRVEYMFVGYSVQEKLYKHAESIGVSKKRLDGVFQYPRGSRAMHGLIRHEPGHTDHVHIRFKCPRHNEACL